MQDIRDGSCPLCQHHELLRSQLVDQRGDHPDRPAAVYTEEVQTWKGIDCRQYGRLTLYTCRRCGYTQLFASNPEEIPVVRGVVELLVGPKRTEPYR